MPSLVIFLFQWCWGLWGVPCLLLHHGFVKTFPDFDIKLISLPKYTLYPMICTTETTQKYTYICHVSTPDIVYKTWPCEQCFHLAHKLSKHFMNGNGDSILFQSSITCLLSYWIEKQHLTCWAIHLISLKFLLSYTHWSLFLFKAVMSQWHLIGWVK